MSFIAPGAVGASFVAALLCVLSLAARSPGDRLFGQFLFPWIEAGAFRAPAALQLDPLSSVMILVVTGVGFLIHVYSVGYMRDDEDYGRFFAYLNLFVFSMLVIVLADNLLLLFVFWEATTIFSYLLIGFDHESQAARENARQVREQINSQMWEQINRFYLLVRQSSIESIWKTQPHEFFRTIKEGIHFFQGLTDSTLGHVREIRQRADIDGGYFAVTKIPIPKYELHQGELGEFREQLRASEPQVLVTLGIDWNIGLKRKLAGELLDRVRDGMGVVIQLRNLEGEPELKEALAQAQREQ